MTTTTTSSISSNDNNSQTYNGKRLNVSVSRNSVRPYAIDPLHGHQDDRRVDIFVDSLSAVGFSRDLIVVDTDDGRYAALEGAHRLAAARELNLLVPVTIVSARGPAADEFVADLVAGPRTWERCDLLEEVGLSDESDVLWAEQTEE